MAGIIKRGNIYWACWTQDGKQVRRTTHIPVSRPGVEARALKKLARATAEGMEATAKNLTTLDLALAAVQAAAGQDCSEKAREVTVQELYNEYCRLNKYPKHLVNGYKKLCEFAPNVAHEKLCWLTPVRCQNFLDWLNKNYATSTAMTYGGALKAMIKYARKSGFLRDDPMENIKIQSIAPPQKREIFTAEEVKTMIEKMPGEWPDAIRVCLGLGGQRLGDIALLTWAQYEEEKGIITLTTRKTGRFLRKPVILPLKRVFARRHKAIGQISEYIFPYLSTSYNICGASNLSREFIEELEKIGIVGRANEAEAVTGRRRTLRSKSFHSLRGTAVTWLLDAGVPSELVRYIVGHDIADIERKYYYKPALEAEEKALATITKLL